MVTGIKKVLASGTHGRRFSEIEENVIIAEFAKAKLEGTTLGVAQVRKAVAEFNTTNGAEGRTRAAIVQAIARLIKAGKLSEKQMDPGNASRTKYTETEESFIQDIVSKASAADEKLTVTAIHKALVDAKVSPKERSLPSLRAHLSNLVKKSEAPVAAADGVTA